MRDLAKGLLLGLSLALAGSMALPVMSAETESKSKDEQKQEKQDKKKDKIDGVADDTLKELFKSSPRARELYEKSFGYAVFDNRKTAFMVSSGGGKGVAVEKKSGERTYMKTASVGANIGIGIKFYRVVFLFQDSVTFRRFVDQGWEAGTSAGATAGATGAQMEVSFVNGMAIFQIGEKGLMANADVSGTKYWKSGLNE